MFIMLAFLKEDREIYVMVMLYAYIHVWVGVFISLPYLITYYISGKVIPRHPILSMYRLYFE